MSSQKNISRTDASSQSRKEDVRDIHKSPPGEPPNSTRNSGFSNSPHVLELLHFSDEEFIQAAYQGVLGREPDSEGLTNYLAALRSKKLTKIEILEVLRNSPEGRKRGIRLRGLWWRKSILRIPLVGHIIRQHTLLVEASPLAALEKNFAAIETRSEALEKNMNASEARMNASEARMNASEARMDASEARMDASEKRIGDLTTLTQVNLPEEIYLAFENRFRGKRDEIRKRMEVYLPYLPPIDSNPTILDIGCGRGEWLETLASKGYDGTGIDLNQEMIKACTAIGLKVKHIDVLTYLSTIPKNSIDVITSFHVIEHLPLLVLLEFLRQSYRTLKKGGVLIIETPNPENLMVGAHTFHFDPSHLKPIPPALALFYLGNAGFKIKEILRLHPPAEDEKSEANEEKWSKIGLDYSVVCEKFTALSE